MGGGGFCWGAVNTTCQRFYKLVIFPTWPQNLFNPQVCIYTVCVYYQRCLEWNQNYCEPETLQHQRKPLKSEVKFLEKEIQECWFKEAGKGLNWELVKAKGTSIEKKKNPTMKTEVKTNRRKAKRNINVVW